MDGINLRKTIIYIGIFVVLCGLIIFFLSKLGIGLGKLPGDINIKKDHISFHFPVATSIIVSIVLTVILNVVLWLFRKH